MQALLKLAWRNIVHYRVAQLAALASAAAACAALTGALLVGDSLRGSLRRGVLDRLGGVHHAVQSPRFFRAALADALPDAAPLLIVAGGATHAETRRRAERVEVLGADGRFFALHAGAARRSDDRGAGDDRAGDERFVTLNADLAAQLGAVVGDEVLLRVGKAADTPTESVLGRKEDTSATLRARVGEIIPSRGAGAFTLRPQVAPPLLAIVPLTTLQRAIGQPGRANTLLCGASAASEESLRAHLTLEDYGLRMRIDESRRVATLESRGLYLDPGAEQAARSLATTLGHRSVGVRAHLANEISVLGAAPTDGRAVPYSTVAAVEQGVGLPGIAADAALQAPGAGEVLLSEWALAALGLPRDARPHVRLTYYVSDPNGQLRTESAEFQTIGAVGMRGLGADPAWVPEYPGITDTAHIRDWDPPFPVDLKRITPADEEYWEQHRAAPKAFVSLADGQRLWSERGERFGSLTGLRILLRDGGDVGALTQTYERELLTRLEPARFGLRLEPVREQALRAAGGATDFAGLFLGFSFFLIAAALGLIVLVQRLGIERRVREVGLLLALGWSGRAIRGVLLVEAGLVCAAGVVLGQLLAVGYAGLMLIGLSSWWVDAVNTRSIVLHATPTSFAIGSLAGLGLALGAAGWALRGLLRAAPRGLLAGVVPSGASGTAPARASGVVAISAIGGALGLGVWSAVSGANPGLFFAAGAAALVGGLAGLRSGLLRRASVSVHAPGVLSILRHGARNLRRRHGRSLLVSGLLACATFLIVALEVMQIQPVADERDPRSGTGGYSLVGESALPIQFDLNMAAGQEALSLSAETRRLLQSARVVGMRFRPGDETSCTGLYQAREPRIAGIGEDFRRNGGFAFAATIRASADAEPWALLDEPLSDGAIPAIGDEAAVRWQLKLGLGKDLLVTDERGAPQRLRFVALLRGSVLQSEVLVSQAAFERLFPNRSGRQFFLIRAPAEQSAALAGALERDLEPYALDITQASDRLAAYFAVQNTYIRTFQALGGAGLLLGTLGVAAVLLRGVWERRAELALLAAVGWPPRVIRRLLLAEHLALVAAGIGIGLLAAGLAVYPVLHSRPLAELPWFGVASMLGGVSLTAVLSMLIALRCALRGSIMQALRSE